MKENMPYKELLTVILTLAFFPFVTMSFFAHPQVDDHWMVNQIKELGFFKSMSTFYLTWFGRYFTVAFQSFNPLYFDFIEGFKVNPILMMLLFIIILLLIIKALSFDFLSFREKLSASLVVLLSFLIKMPGLNDGLYWMGAVINYEFAGILILVMLYLLMLYEKAVARQKPTRSLIVSICLLIAIISGINEPAMFVVAMLIFYIFIYKYFSSRKFSAVYILFGLLSANCSYIVIAAPGNWVRSEAFYPTRANLEFSLLNALYKTLHGCYEWLFQSPTFVLSIIMIPLVLKIVRNAEKSGTVLVRCSPLYVLGIILSLVYATFFMIFWSVGDAYWPVRTANFACLVFLMGWFYFAYMLIMYLNEKHPSILQFISKYSLPLVLLFSLIPLADFKNNNLYLAYSELLDGSAYTYNKEMYKRYADIENCKTDFCEVDPLTYHPKSLVFEDLTPNPFDYRNVYWAKYYNKKGVMIRWAPQRN